MDELRRISSRLSEVQDAEQMLAGIVAHMPIPVVLYRPDGECLAANKACREMLGIDLTASYNILTDPAAIAAGMSDLARRALGGEPAYSPPHWFNPTVLQGTARKLAIATWLFPLHDAQGAVKYIAACCTDATAELLLQQENDRQQMLRQYSQEVTILSLEDGTITYVSPSCEQVLGYLPEELARVGPRILHPDDGELYMRVRARVFSIPDARAKMQCRLLHKDGSYRWVSITGTHLTGHPTLRGLITHVHDITALKAAEEKQRQTAAMLEEALNVARAVAWSRNLLTGEATIIGEAAEKFRMRPGMTLEEVLATYHPDDRARAIGLLMTPPGSPPVRGERIRVLHPDTGEVVWTEVHGAAIRDAGGKMIGTKGIRVDVTDRVRAEETAARAAELEAENIRIRAIDETRGQMLAHLSHELRTPLNAIIGFGELLQDGEAGPLSEDQKDFVDTILSSATHLLTIIEELLDLASIEAGKLEIEPEPVELRALARDVCAALQRPAEAKRISLTAEVDPGISHAVIDAQRFRQILFNYISNAIKFTPKGGRIAVRVRPEGPGALRLEVEDTGIGIAPADIPRLFKEFERVGPASRAGAGLGLAITRSLVESLGGSVGATSVPGKGSVFYAVVPRNASAIAAPE